MADHPREEVKTRRIRPLRAVRRTRPTAPRRSPRAISLTCVERDLVERGDRGVRVDLLAEHDRLGGRVAGDRVGVLERQHAAAGGVGAGALELLLLRPVGAQLVDDLAHPLVRLDALGRLEARGELQDRHVGEACGRSSRRSRRGRAARGSRRTGASPSSRPAASSRRSARRARPGRVGSIVRAVAHPQVRLVGVALLDERLRRERRRGLEAAVGGDRGEAAEGSASSPSSGSESRLPTRNAPPRPPAHWRARNATIASRVKVRRCSSGPRTGRPSGWSPNAARSIRCSATTDGWSCARAISWMTTPRSRSSSSASIFGRPDEVGQQVDRLAGHLGAAGDVEGDEVVRRVRVEHRAHALGGLVDLAVVVVLLAALEDQVLEEVGHPVLLGALGARAGVERDEDGHGARALDLHRCSGSPLGREEEWIIAMR